MFGENFFPTPSKLIRKMLEPYFKKHRAYGDETLDLSDMEILEPSAGKGDICDFIKDKADRYNSGINISCIEIEPELQSILRDKGYPVLAPDFLEYNENYFWDLIIMNPPFDKGAEHLLHAIRMARNTDIICLLNAETVRNPHTKIRKLLKCYLDEQEGSVEYIQDAFKEHSERKTGVEIALIRLKMEDPDETFDYNFDKEKLPELNFDFDVENDALARKDLVGNMNIQFKIVMETYKKSLEAESRHDFYMSNMTSISDSYYQSMYLERGSNKQKYNQLSKSLKVFMWRQVIKELDVQKYMSAKVKSNFEAFIAQQSEVAFTKENVASFFQMIMNNRVNIWEEAIVDVFEVLTRYTQENRFHVEGWKTNDKYKINRRIILPSWVSWQDSYDTQEYMKEHGKNFSLSYHRSQEYTDIDKVLAYISGHALPHWCCIDSVLESHFKTLGRVCIGDKFDNTTFSGYFDIKFFKKGTVHLYFKDKKLWDEFNMRACAGKDWLPGPEKRQWEEELRRRRATKKKEEHQEDEPLTIGTGTTLFG